MTCVFFFFDKRGSRKWACFAILKETAPVRREGGVTEWGRVVPLRFVSCVHLKLHFFFGGGW